MSTEIATTFTASLHAMESAANFVRAIAPGPALPEALKVWDKLDQYGKPAPGAKIDLTATTANLLIVCMAAHGLGLELWAAMTGIYLVKGSITISGPTAITLIRAKSGLLDVRFESVGDPDKPGFKGRFVGKRRSEATGELFDEVGPWVFTDQMKAKHGQRWKKGGDDRGKEPNLDSAWYTDPARQTEYAAARSFARTKCPWVLNGVSVDDGTDERLDEAVIIDEPRRPSSRAVITSATPLALGPAVTTQPAEPAPVVDVAPPSEPAVARVDAPAPVARSAPKGTPLPPIDEMLAALPERFVGVDDRVWEVFSERAVEAVQTAASPEPQSVEAETFVAAMTKTIGTVYVYHTDPVRWSGGKKRPATPQNLEDELARALGMVGT